MWYSPFSITSELPKFSPCQIHQKRDFCLMKPSVLVVDDSEDTRCMIQYFLVEDYNVVTAAGGATALNLLNAFHPDVIVTDLMMPIMDGMSLIKALKKSKTCRNIPVIILSGFVDCYPEEVVQAGVTVVLKKPEGTLRLAETIKQVLMQSHSG